MEVLNTATRYGLVSRALHWVIVLAIVAQWLLAEAGDEALPLHYSLGLTVLLLAVLRLGWLLVNRKPAWPPDTRPYEIKMARVVHFCFYALLFAIPLTGWALASAEGESLRFFDWFAVAPLPGGSEETLEELHEGLFNALVVLAVLHVAGAAKHWFAAHRRSA